MRFNFFNFGKREQEQKPQEELNKTEGDKGFFEKYREVNRPENNPQLMQMRDKNEEEREWREQERRKKLEKLSKEKEIVVKDIRE
ncbi:MAG TPA: hypothetical protein ENL06_02880 [Candidatus Portnoybacteria bacterium]|nr:hypothetical protein [Candidatus Portnoybacteria bacterium]